MDGDNQNRDLPTEIAGRLVKPSQWAVICRDRLVFGLVVAAAFDCWGPLRVTNIGIIVERALTEKDAEQLAALLDREATRAFTLRDAIKRLGVFAGEHSGLDMRWYRARDALVPSGSAGDVR